jgi:hypothetical protein
MSKAEAHMSKGRRLKELMQEKPYLVTPGITTALHAMIVEQAGYDFVYTGGYDASLTLLGLPDVGLMTETEMVANLRNIAKATSLPVVADADTGYGNAINVIRTVENYEAAGLAAMHIEDQVAPKRCGHVAGKIVVPLEEAVGKVRAAVEAKRDPDFMIIARTDAVAAAGGFRRPGVSAELCGSDASHVSRAAALFQLFVEPEVARVRCEVRGRRRDGLQDHARVARRDARHDAGVLGLRGRHESSRRGRRDRFREAAHRPPDGRISRDGGIPADQGARGEVSAGRRSEEEIRWSGRPVKEHVVLRAPRDRHRMPAGASR